MRFPNAYKGVSKLFLAQILEIIGVIATLISIIVMIAGATAGNAALAGGGVLATGISLIAIPILSIIAFVMTLVGLNQGKKDEPAFQTAFIMTIIGLVLSIISYLVTNTNPWLAGWMQFASSIFSLGSLEYVIVAGMSLARQLGDSKMEAFGGKMRILITILWILLLVIYLFRNNASDVFYWISLGASLLELVVSIMYIVFLSRTKKMLKD